MHWAKVFIVLSIIVIAEGVSARDFTDKTGRKIEAEIIGYLDDSIDLQRGKQTFTVAIDKFSEPDQEFIREWIELNPEKVVYKFKFFTSYDDGSMVARKNVRHLGDTLKTRKDTYTTIIYNLGGAELTDLTVKYEVYVDDVVDGKGRHYYKRVSTSELRGKTKTFPGRVGEFSLDPITGKMEFDHQFEVQSYVSPKNGAVKSYINDRVIGIRIKVYKGKDEIAEHTDSRGLIDMDKIQWSGRSGSVAKPVSLNGKKLR